MSSREWRNVHAVVLYGCIAMLAVSAVGCQAGPALSYEEEILAERTLKDLAFRESPDSPVPLERRAVMLPLKYFPPDPSYRVPAALRIAEDQPEFQIPTSTGKLRWMRKVGVLAFTLKGQQMTLAALIEASATTVDRLFVPFGDLTSGTETYVAGRYLDLDRTATGLYVVDFNRAYTPYCYFNETYDCPFPPAENRLQVPVRAGERLSPS